MKNLHELDKFRIEHPYWPQNDKAGTFKVFAGGRSFIVLASTDTIGEDGIWEHISVTPKNAKRCPTWDEMAEIKAMFFNDEEEAVEFHPKKSKYVNMQPYVLHIWRPVDGILRMPFGAGGHMATLEERDKRLEELWAVLEDIPMDPDTEKTEADFLHFPAGTDKMDLWRWFDERYSKGVPGLLYPGTDAREAEALFRLKKSCIECESEDCAYNNDGICRFPMVYGRQPNITEDDGCTEFQVKEGTGHVERRD